jgi:glutaredoxin 3
MVLPHTTGEGFIMVKNITIFTTTTCAYCPMVKKYLGAKGLAYDEVNLDESPEH